MTNRLKALELQGYKTFANKTKFEFPGQVTAIVGPNGSGKSNIADSIRWVLGEQAYSLLRGKKTLDMIFSGSENRARSSMASVSITFDNEGGWLPVEFSEVNITRRAYRDGGNEYLINNQRVRLKEINELLANSGLGERTYTIIGQGLVDTALSLRPEERRKFFEEAAGIGLYRARREDAVQKLDKTIRNMERIQDLIYEIKPRISSLQKNKEKASQYRQVQSDLQLLLKDWYGYHWHQLQKELKDADEFYLHQKSELEKAQEKKEILEEQLNQIQGNLNENRALLADMHKEISLYHSETEQITRTIAVLDEREKTLRQRQSEIKNEIESNHDQEQYIQAELIGLESDSDKFKQEFKEVSKLLETVSLKLTEKINEQQEIERLRTELQKSILAGESRLLNLKTNIDNSSREIEIKKNEINRINEFVAEINISIEKLSGHDTELSKNFDALTKDITEKEELSKYYLEQIEIHHKKFNDLIDEKNNLTSQILKIKAELEVLIDAEEHLTGFNSGSSEILNAARSKALPGNIALIVDHLNIPEKYETAIAAVLGEEVEGILLENINQAQSIINFLITKKIPRTILVPSNLKKSFKFDNPFSGKNFLKADSIITEKSKFADSLRSLLSRTIIVEDYQTALNYFEEIPIGWRFVTVNGEVFDSNGTISAGTENHVKPLKRKREKSSLELELDDSKKILSELDNAIVINSKKSTQLSENQKQINADIQKIKEKISSLKFESRKIELELDQKKRILDDEINRRKSFEQQIHAIGDENKKLKELVISEEQKIKSLNIESEKISAIDKNVEIDELRTQVLELTSRKSVAEKLNIQHVQTLNRTRENSKSISQSKIALTLKLSELDKNIEESISEKNSLNDKNEILAQKMVVIRDRILPLEEKVESIIGAQGELLKHVDTGRKNFAVAERHVLQSQLQTEKIRDKLNNIKQKIEEDFGLLDGESTGYRFDQPLPLEGIVASLPKLAELPNGFESEISQKKSFLRRIGPVNPEAEREFDEVNERFRFLTEQLEDLDKAEKDLRKVVNELDSLMKKEFLVTFSKVEAEFSSIFNQLFNGGTARLFIEDEENILDGGIEIEATLPGRRKQELGLLSGGERSLTAVALIFALLKISPTPFCILDEVDAMLDESNVVRFGELLRELSDTTQFIVITHNRNTVQLADVLYGVTMGKDSVSQVISLKMDELTEEMVQ